MECFRDKEKRKTAITEVAAKISHSSQLLALAKVCKVSSASFNEGMKVLASQPTPKKSKKVMIRYSSDLVKCRPEGRAAAVTSPMMGLSTGEVMAAIRIRRGGSLAMMPISSRNKPKTSWAK